MRGFSPPKRVSFLAVVVGLTALLLPGAVAGKSAQNRLIATVGSGPDGFGDLITLADEAGNRVSQLDPGTYTIEVRDVSDIHNFHLIGPSVNVRSSVERRETLTWTVTFTDAVYRYLCDPHLWTMRGTFRVGNPPPPPPTLSGSVGPGSSISLKSGGRRVGRLAAGSYRVTVRDRSRRDNFHLTGAGVNKATGVRFRGTITWTVGFQAGQAYRYVSDPRRTRLRGSFRAT